MKKSRTLSVGQLAGGCLLAVAAAGIGTVRADTHTVAAGETETLNNVTETSRFVKDGEGTLVLGGDNSFKRATMKEGDLTISGGSTTISDAHDGNASDSGNIFAMSGGNLTLKDGATLTMSTADGKGYLIQHGGTFLVTNATFDVSGVDEYMNGFENNGGFTESRFVIATGGVVRAKRFRPSGATSANHQNNTSLDLNAGGKLYLDQFFGDTTIRYGRINSNSCRHCVALVHIAAAFPAENLCSRRNQCIVGQYTWCHYHAGCNGTLCVGHGAECQFRTCTENAQCLS